MKIRTQKKQKTTVKFAKITPMQMELLDLFANKELSKKEVVEIKDMLSNYFLEKAQDELEKLAEEKDWDLKEKSKDWSRARPGQEKFRMPYHRDQSS